MAFERNRIDGTSALHQLRPDDVILIDEDLVTHLGEAVIYLELSGNHYVELYFPALAGVVEAKWLKLAADLLTNLTAIDNEVQRVSEEQWSRSTFPSSYYEGHLSYIALTDGAVVLRYFVIGCNAEWDERFIRTESGWVRAVEAEPGAAVENGGGKQASRDA